MNYFSTIICLPVQARFADISVNFQSIIAAESGIGCKKVKKYEIQDTVFLISLQNIVSIMQIGSSCR